MDADHNNPIVINSDDEDDDDDVVLVKEERVAVNADDKNEDDVIFVSEKPSTLEMKCRLKKNKSTKCQTALTSGESGRDNSCSIPNIEYFQSVISSFSLVDDIFQPLGVSDPAVLTIDALPTGDRDNVGQTKPSEAACASVIVSDQVEISLNKPSGSKEISAVKLLHGELDLCPGNNLDNSVPASSSTEQHRMSQLQFSKAESGFSESSQNLNTKLDILDITQNYFDPFLAESSKAAGTADYVTSSTANHMPNGQSASWVDKHSVRNICPGSKSRDIIINDHSERYDSSPSNSTISGLQDFDICGNGTAIDSGTPATSSVSGEIMNNVNSVLCPSVDYSHRVHPDKSQHSESMPKELVRGSDLNDGTIMHYSGSTHFSALEHYLNSEAQSSKKTSNSTDSTQSSQKTSNSTDSTQSSQKTSNSTDSTQSVDFNNFAGLFDFLDLVPPNDISQMQHDSESGDKFSGESNHRHAKSNGISKFANSVCRKQILNPRSEESATTESSLTNVSQGNCSATALDGQARKGTFLLPSKESTIYLWNKQPQKSSTTAIFSPQKDNQLRISLCQSSSSRRHYLNSSSGIPKTGKQLSAHLKCFMPVRKRRLNNYKRYPKGFIKTTSHLASKKSISRRPIIKVEKIDASQWQIVSSNSTAVDNGGAKTDTPESSVGKGGAKIESPAGQFLAGKRKNVSELSEREKRSLKVKLKRYPLTECSAPVARFTAQDHPSKIGVKKSFIRRQESLLEEAYLKKTQLKINNHKSRDENDQRELEGQRKEVKMCITCDLNVSNEKHSKCVKGHVICASCLEPQVRGILKGDVKQKYIKCPSSSCFEVVHFDELKKTLPSFVVEILEEKLDKEYMNYIAKWMFTDEQLKSRSEFATQDPNMTPCPTLSTIKYDEIDNHECRDIADDLPSSWAQMEQGASVMAFEVVPDTDEYRALACEFYESLSFGDYDIVRIIRVQNPILWKYFSLKQSEMRQENEGVDVHERQLYHGTHRSTLEAIARKGFDWRLSGKHGTAYGCGSYFASKASYSHAYTDRAGSGMSVQVGGSYMLQTSTGLNSLLMGYTPLWSRPRWKLTSHSFRTDLNIPSPPPAHGQLSTHNKMTNQAPIFATAGLTSGTTSNHSSDRAHPKTSSTTSKVAGYQLIENYQSCLFPSDMLTNPNLYNSFSSQMQPCSSSDRSYFPSASTSGSKLSSPVTLTLLTPIVDSTGYSSKQTNLLGFHRTSYSYPNGLTENRSRFHRTSYSYPNGLTENRSRFDRTSYAPNDLTENRSTNIFSQMHVKGTADLAKAFEREPNSNTHFMFVARVLVGHHTIGKSGLKRPPPLDENNPYGKSYDSCVDHNLFPQIYVIFDSHQAYPEYIIEYNWHKE